MSEKLITLTTYTYNTEAYILIAKLEAEGIKSFLKNEHTLSQQQFLSNAVGGLDVQVPESDLEKAKLVLSALDERNKSANSVPAWLTKDYSKVLIYCPDCESTNVYKKKGFSFGAKEHRCADCDYQWKE